MDKINTLSTLNEHARILKRGTIALENYGHSNKQKAKMEHQQEMAKKQTALHQKMGAKITHERHMVKLEYEAQKRKEHMEAI